ncbi:MAG: FecR domain-containing protein [Opitutaceae bacterium]|nr:FecR domain-containing protein [Opitutaceae bacterium]
MPMKNILRSLLGGLFAAAFVVVAQAADLVPGAFSAGTVEGDVTYKLAGSSQYLPLTAGTALPQGATIKTGPDSTASIVFSNGAVATITAESEVEITKFEQEVFSGPLPTGAEPSISNTEINVANGTVVSKVAKLKTGSSYIVKSPVGAAGVRGTTFSVTFNKVTREYTVKTLTGLVVWQSAPGAAQTAASVDVPTGTAYSGGPAVRQLEPAEIVVIEAAIAKAIIAINNAPSANPAPGTPGSETPARGPVINADGSITISVNT